MAKLVHEKRPEGKSTSYRFVRNATSGRRFKATHELRTAPDGSPAIAILISAVDDSNRALPNGLGDPDISSITHTLTKVELQDPTFDVEARVAAMMETAVEAKENELNALSTVQRLSATWTGDAPLALDKRPK